MDTLLTAAALPIIALCYYVYKKDNNKEPIDLLLKLLGFGALSVVPIIIGELFVEDFTNVEKVTNFIEIFIKTFIGVAIFEEGFKWIFVKKQGYDNREFDEIYDIIIYSVFVSLGFALVENIGYVIFSEHQMMTAILRAVLSVPGHACFAVLMGYYLAKAKVAKINNNEKLYTQNISFSLLMPMLFHTMYDALIEWYANTGNNMIILFFFLFDITMVVIGFIIVNKMSKVQQNISTNLQSGTLAANDGHIELVSEKPINFCPVCGNSVSVGSYCSKCGLKIR